MNMMQIQSFIKSAECLSFSEASKSFHYSQSAVSRQIAALEQELNCQLFIRDKNMLHLTNAGATLFKDCQRIYQAYLDLLQKANNPMLNPTGSLRIGVLDGMIIGDLLTKPLQKFEQLYPEVSLEIYSYDYREIWDRLCQNKIDLAISLRFEAEEYSTLSYKLISPNPQQS